MTALFPFLWLFWQFDLHSFLTDEFLDMINKTKNTNVGNDNLGNVSNEAPGDTEEDDFKDEARETGEYLECTETGSVEATNRIFAFN